MAKECVSGEKFYGSTTLGERGQIVIPAQARKDMGLEKGEQLLVFRLAPGMLALFKLEEVEKFATELSERLKAVREIIARVE